jgi:glycyl-tRNA synthetase beta chain
LKELSIEALKPYDIKDREGVVSSIVRFFEQRFDPIFQPAGYSADVIASVIHFVGDKPLFIIKDRMDALMQLKANSDYEDFVLVIKRINNIASKTDIPPVNKSLFAHEEEELLYSAVETAAPQILTCIARNEPSEAINILINLKDPVNRFFDKVLIMDKNEDIKQNRLSLIKTIQSIGHQIADLSKLG